ncbi:hypothetical protein CEXT_493671 [Caerostris extrusa]|uniref:Uncharacterized protein n=1 Tax=Caerostris extrusa TaxID=172846 RepID=A0AAV4PGD6_CAEEX|nr:hypothetical protein CEXT_493671 [Caerostris extrusa]
MLVDGTNSAADMSSDSTVTTVGPQPSQDDPIEITDEIKASQLKRQKNYEIAYLILRELLSERYNLRRDVTVNFVESKINVENLIVNRLQF